MMKVIVSTLVCLLAASQVHCTVEPRLIGAAGTPPYVVAIFDANSNPDRIVCSGAIISSYWVLTSAACVKKFNNQNIRVGKNLALNAAILTKPPLHIHPSFNPTTLANDIALIELADHINPAWLEIQMESVNVNLAGKTAIASGYGLKKKDSPDPQGTLQQNTVVILDNPTCQKYVPTSTSRLCTYESIGCRGDQGGPLEVDGTLVGLISLLEHQTLICGNDVVTPVTTYTRIFPYRSWIRSITKINV